MWSIVTDSSSLIRVEPESNERSIASSMGLQTVRGLRPPVRLATDASPTNVKKPPEGGFRCLWWSMQDLNLRPCACKAPALPLRQSTKCLLSQCVCILCHMFCPSARVDWATFRNLWRCGGCSGVWRWVVLCAGLILERFLRVGSQRRRRFRKVFGKRLMISPWEKAQAPASTLR